ncbi:hypothetical protein ACF0H5_008650 [Mactra antiquata]
MLKLFESTDEIQFDETLKLEFYPALQNAEIRPPMFGDLVVGSSYKSTDCRLSDLRARDCGPNIPSVSLAEQNSVKSCDVSTQTVAINDIKHMEGDQNTHLNNQTFSNTSKTSESSSRGRTVTPPPGIYAESIPCTFQSSNITNPPSQYSNMIMPPPGFVARPPANHMGINFQMNQSVFVPQLQNIPAQSYLGHYQVPYNYQFGGAPVPNSYRFQAQPQPSTSLPKASARPVNTVRKNPLGSNTSKKDNSVLDKPLPSCPAPKQTASLAKDVTLSPSDTLDSAVKSTFHSAEEKTDESSPVIKNGEGSFLTSSFTKATNVSKSPSPVSLNTEKPVNKTSSDTVIKATTATTKSKWDFVIEASKGKRKVLTGTDIEKRKKQNDSSIENDMLEAIENETKKLNLGKDDIEIDYIQRTDEADTVVEPVKKSKDIVSLSEGKWKERKGDNTDISRSGDSTILSDVNEMKKKLAERRLPRFPMKPLRKPFHETNVLLNIFPSPDKNNNNMSTNAAPNVITTAKESALSEEDNKNKSKIDTPDKDISDNGYAPAKDSVEENVSATLALGHVKVKVEPVEEVNVKQEPIDEWSDAYELPKDKNNLVEKNTNSANKTVASKTVDLSASKSIDLGASKTFDLGASKSVDLGVSSETVDLGASSKTVDLGASSKTVDLGASSKVVDLGASKTVDLGASSKTVDIGASKTVDLGASKTVDLGASSKTVDLGASKTVDLGASKTVDVDSVVVKKEFEIKKEKVEKDSGDQFSEKKNECTPCKTINEKHSTITSNIKPSGGRLDTPSKRRSSQSLSERLGALQSHWIGKKHANMKAKHLYTCTQDMNYPIGITTTMEGDIIVMDTGNHIVKMFDSLGNFVKTFERTMTPPLHRPSAAVVNEYGYVFVKDDHCIRIFDKAGLYVKSIGAHLFSKPYGLALTPARCLLVLETDRRNPQLIHMSQDGLKEWKYLYTPLTMAPQASKCRFLAVSENNVFVSDLGISSVYITTFKGIFVRTVGWPGIGIQQFNEPSGITTDIYGNVVIADSRNNRVQVYRHDGAYTGLIDFDTRIVRPSGIHLTNNNKLMVVNFLNHNVKVFELYPA